MANNCGTTSFAPTATGTKTVALGMTPTWMQIYIQGSGLKPSKGFMYGGDQYAYSDDTTALPVNKAIQVKNTSGTVVLEGTWTSFASSQVNFNITTNTLSSVQSALIIFGN